MQQWLLFLRQTGAAAGIPLVVAGLCLMFFGWRMWKVCVMLAFGCVGAGIGWKLGGRTGNEELYGIPMGLILAGLSSMTVNLGLTVLGGVVGSAGVYMFMHGLHFDGLPLWATCGAAFFATGAYAFLHRQHMVVFMTAVMGAILLMSGVTAWLVAVPSINDTLITLAEQTSFVAPFLLLVPTSASCFFQMSEIRKFETSI